MTKKKKTTRKKTARRTKASGSAASASKASKKKSKSRKKTASSSARASGSKKRSKKKASAKASAGTSKSGTKKKTVRKSAKKAAAPRASNAKAASVSKPPAPQPPPASGGEGSASAIPEPVASARPAPRRVDPDTPSNGDRTTAAERTPLSDAQLRKVKTGLTRKDINYFKSLLLEKRAEIVGDVMSMEDARSGKVGNLSNMPLHMADVGSDNYETEFNLGLVESERRLLREIDDALERISNRTYGVCIESGEPINKARLEIKPWAKYCIDVARERERRGLPTG